MKCLLSLSLSATGIRPVGLFLAVVFFHPCFSQIAADFVLAVIFYMHIF
jgi:hypothetical protein